MKNHPNKSNHGQTYPPGVRSSVLSSGSRTPWRFIPLTQGKYAIVDFEDYKRLKRYKWCAVRDKGTFYAIRTDRTNGKKRTIRMHREIMKVMQGFQIDHLNGNGLDNRKLNLRICTNAQNQWNRHPLPSIGGIWWDKKRKRFRIRMMSNGKRKYLGQYKEKSEAIRTYQKAVKERQRNYIEVNELSGLVTEDLAEAHI